MRLEWIDDILAVLDSGSLARAAEKRLLTQSAFTRRVRAIEDHIGATLFDRSRKPITLMPGVQTLEAELRDLSAQLHQMQQRLQAASAQAGQSLSFVCQHALTTTVSPQAVRALASKDGASVRVRSGNQDECLMQLISKRVDFAIMYALPDDGALGPGAAFEAAPLGTDMLIPVATPRMRRRMSFEALPIISYPPEVFLGQVFTRKISPRLPKNTNISAIAETALTLAMLQLVLTEIGIAWLPQSLIGDHLERGSLVRLDDTLPAQPLTIKMLRLREAHSPQREALWQKLAQTLQLPMTAD